MVQSDPLELFHGTSAEGIEGISHHGFRLPPESDTNMFGRGVYFAKDSSKSAQEIYTRGSKCLLLCEVALGRYCTCEGLDDSGFKLRKLVNKTANGNRSYLKADREEIRKLGFDSVYAKRGTQGQGGVRFDEYIVYDPNLALPKYVVHFQLLSLTMTPRALTPAPNQLLIPIPCPADKSAVSDDPMDLHYRMAESQFLRMFRSLGGSASICEVALVNNPKIQEAYENTKREFQSCNIPTDEKWVFHGTAEANITCIARDGLVVGGEDGVPITSGAALGNGCYTAADPNTSMGYTRGGKKMFLTRILPGRTGPEQRGPGNTNNSLARGNVVVVFTKQQVLPVYVLTFQ